MADRLLGGHLEERLKALRSAGLSWDDIARRLYEEGGVEVTPMTLRRWARQLGVEAAA